MRIRWACALLPFCLNAETKLATPAPVQPQKTVTVHIFIHGTRLPGFALMSPQAVINQEISDDCRYVQILKRIRADQRFFDRQIIMDMGLVPIGQDLITQWGQQKLPSDVACKGAVQAIGAYDQFVNKTNTTNLYYAYGWVGVLDDRYRNNDAKDLYVRLAALMKLLHAQYPGQNIKLILHGHSHGGNLILYLAHHEKQLKQGLVIDHAYLYGTPIQQETAHFCMDPIFKNIAIFYSRADLIQISDTISVKSHTSCRKFSDLVKLKKRTNNVQEVCVQANDNPRAFGHASYFYLGEYANRTHRSRGKYQVFKQLNPSPLVILAPEFMRALDTLQTRDPHNYSFILNIKTAKDSCALNVCCKHHKKDIVSQELGEKLAAINVRVRKTWRPRGGTNVSSRAKQLTTCMFAPREPVPSEPVPQGPVAQEPVPSDQ